jgi:hypothetical protein
MTNVMLKDLIVRRATDDVRQLLRVVFREKYRFARFIFSQSPPAIVIDLASQAGVAASYLGLLFPTSKIFVVEGSNQNF